jgi:DNA polymerase eta
MANLFLASLPAARSRCVCHIDLDCFYVAVERKRRPSLEGRACAVVQYNNNNAARQRGESAFGGGAIIALSYEAKALGVRRHMRGEEARRVCPSIELVTVPVKNEKADLTHYREAGTEVFSRLSSSAARCERTSIDEAYLDVTDMAFALIRGGIAELEQRISADEDARCTRVVTDDGSGDAPPPPIEAAAEVPVAGGALRPPQVLGKNDGECVGLERWWCDTLAPLIRSGSEAGEMEEEEETSSSSGRQLLGDGESAAALLLAAGAVVIGRLRAEVTRATGFTLSAGIAHNKMLAKLVSGRNKPDKQTIIPTSAVQRLLQNLPLRELNGFGGRLGDALIEAPNSLRCVGELLPLSREQLRGLLREQEQMTHKAVDNAVVWMWNACRGVCTDTVKARLLAKSMGCGKTFRGPSTLRTVEQVQHYLGCLAEELAARVRSTYTLHRRAPRLLVVSCHTGSKVVKRKGVEFSLTGAVAGSGGGGAVGGSKSCRFPGGEDGSFTPARIASAAYALVEAAVQAGGGATTTAKKGGLQCTALYITATSFFELPASAERIDRFFTAGAGAADVGAASQEVGGGRSEHARSSATAAATTAMKRSSVIDETMLSQLPPEIRADVERRRHEYELSCTFGSALQPRPKRRRRRPTTALDAFLCNTSAGGPSGDTSSAVAEVQAELEEARASSVVAPLVGRGSGARPGAVAASIDGSDAAAAGAPAGAAEHEASPLGRGGAGAGVSAEVEAEVELSWSNIDRSVLNALPLNMQAELKSRLHRESCTLREGQRRQEASGGGKKKKGGGGNIASFFLQR